MADKIAELFIEIRANTDKLEEDFIKLKGTSIQAANGINNTTKSATNFNKSVGSGTENLGKFTGAMTNALGATGKFGNLLSSVGQSLLQGGIVGAGFAAAAAGITYLIQKAQEASEAFKKAFNELVKFSSALDGVSFEIKLPETWEANETAIKKNNVAIEDYRKKQAQLIADTDGKFVEGVSEQLGAWEESIKLLNLYGEQLDINGTKIKTNNELIKSGLAEQITQTQKSLVELTKNRQRRGEIYDEQQKLLVGHTKEEQALIKQSDAYRILTAENRKLVESANTILGIEKVTIKDKKEEVDLITSILSKRRDIEENVKLVNDALKSGNRSQAEMNDLVLTLIGYYEELEKMGPPKLPEIIDDREFDEEGMFDPLPDIVIPPTTLENFEFVIDKMETISNLSDNIANSFSTLGDNSTSAGEKIAAMISLMSGIVGIITTLESIGAAAKAAEVAASLVTGTAIASAYAPAAAMASLASFGANAIPASAGIASTVALAQGLAIPKFAKGGDFTVPSGFSNDSFPMLVQSGERVQVTPSGRVGDESRLLAEVVGGIKALNKNLINKNMSPIVNLDIDGKKLVKQVTKPNENRLSRSGFNLNEL